MSLIKEKKYHLMSNILYVYKGVAKYKPYLIALVFISIICTAGSKYIWLFLSKYVIEFIHAGMVDDELIKIVIILTVSNIVCMVGLNIVNYGKEPAALYVRPMFMLERNKKHIGMFFENLENKEVLDAVEKSRHATSFTTVGIEGLIRLTLDFCPDLFACIVAVVILSRIHWIMVALVIVFGILSYLSIDKAAKIDKYLTNDSVAFPKRKLQYFKTISRNFEYGKDIRLYQVSDQLVQTQKELNHELHYNICQARKQWLKSGVFTSTLNLLREAILYFGLVYFIVNQQLGIGDFMLYVGCVHTFADTFHNLMCTYANLRRCSREVNDYRTLNEFYEENKAKAKPTLKGRDYEIRFENVSFEYPANHNDALKNMNITISPQEKLAIVGLNGAGKTTFVKLLLKLYKPTEGKIYVNGVDIETIDTESYYQLFAPVFQDMQCYAFSLAENVSMRSDERMDTVRVEQSLRNAGLGEKLDAWEKGLNTPMMKILHDDGIILSGGEKQKMALARALYKDAPIVILDEPTAALDALAESRMYEYFDSLVSGKSAVYISHRLASTRFCDRIAMFEDGQMVEYGTHMELMEKNGKYAEMFHMQSFYYKEEASDETVIC